MKKIKFISLLVLFTAIIFSQQFADDDCVEQILEDKAAIITAEETGKNPKNYPKPEIKIAAPVQVEKAEYNYNIINYINWKIIVLLNAGFLAAIVVLLRRRKIELSKMRNKDLKENIKRLREEKIGSISDSKLKKIRTSLFGRKLKIDPNGAAITEIARKLSVSKGEIHLAAKLNLLYEQNK